MGFFSKLWKGVKKVFKKVGKAIKKAVKGIGKFVGKLGIVGQIGMMFFMPHVAGFLMKGLGGAAQALMGAAGKGLGGTLARGLGTVLDTAHKFATTAGNVFGTVTEGVSQFAKTALNKIPGVNIEGAATNFFGNDSAWSRTLDKASTVFDPFKDTPAAPDPFKETPATPTAPPEPPLDPSSEYQQQMKQDLDYLSETPLSEQTGPSMEGRGPLLPPEQQPSVAAVPEPSSLLSTAGTTLRKSFESDPLAVTQRVFDLAGQAQALTQSPGDVFYGGGAQTQYLFEPTIGMQTPAAPQVDISQGPYGYNAFAQAYDFSQMSPWEYYMQQQKRYA
jgi:hypothetical protein